MKAIKKLLVIILGLVVVLVAASFFLPASYRVERSVTFNAQPKAIYPWIVNPAKWPQWTVWTTNRDATVQFTTSGPESGAGASYQWTGEKMGIGRLTLTRAEPDRGIWYDLDFEEGKYLSRGGITFETMGETTQVTWFNGGQLGANPIGRYWGLAMDRMIGPDFAEGLEHLKRIVEAR